MTFRPSRPPAVAVLGILTLLAGCQVAPEETPTPTPAPVSAGTLDWTACGDALCAEMVVPLDHGSPEDDRTVTLALRRIPATAAPRLGSLLVNPGGPGASGRDFATQFARDGLEQYDIVGWDPRGVGASDPVTCSTATATDEYFALDASPDTDDERTALIEGIDRYAQSCRDRAGDLLDHLSVTDTARDLDLIREALGEETLTYYGASYGTTIGATYAALFPERVGRMVLDAAVMPGRDSTSVQAEGFDAALAGFADWCAEVPCRLGNDAVAQVTALLDELDERPLRVGERQLTQTLAVTGMAAILGGGSDAWPAFGAAVAAAENGDGAQLLLAADQVNGRNPEGSFSGRFESFVATYCADDAVRTAQQADAAWAAEQQAAPVFGYGMGAPYFCVGWTAAPADPVTWPEPPAAPVLIVGAPQDPVSPFAWSQEMAAALGNAVLVPAPGASHVTYGTWECVTDIVTARFVEGTMPAEGTTCA